MHGENLKLVAPCFGAVTPSTGSALFVLAKVTVVKIAYTLITNLMH